MKSRILGLMHGFTLIELLIALLILSVMALMSYRGLGAVLDAREHVSKETEKWRRVAAFVSRFERDVKLAAPRAIRTASETLPAWSGNPNAGAGPLLEFSRFASVEDLERARRIGYHLNERQEIELWVWSGLDLAPGALPERYPVLPAVADFDLQYFSSSQAWGDTWPPLTADTAIPVAVRLRIVLVSGEEISRVFGLRS